MKIKHQEYELIYIYEFIYFILIAISKREVPRELKKSGNKTSSGEIGLDMRTHAGPKVGQDQVSGGVSVLC